MTLVWWWLRPALSRWWSWVWADGFWGSLLLVAAIVPLMAVTVGDVDAWICLSTAAALVACAAAALARGGRRAGDLLLFGALFVLLLRSFLGVGSVVEMIYPVVLLTVTGIGIRGTRRLVPHGS